MFIVSKHLAAALASTAICVISVGSVSFASEALNGGTLTNGVNQTTFRYNSGGTLVFSPSQAYNFNATNATNNYIYGVIASKGYSSPSVLTINGSAETTRVLITTTGGKAHGVQAGANGSTGDGNDFSTINLNAFVTVATNGLASYGIHTVDGGTVDSQATIATQGQYGFGVFAESYSAINQTGGSITTSGDYAVGLLANNDRNAQADGGSITATDTQIVTSGYGAIGAGAANQSHIELNNTTINTTGSLAHGIAASDNSTITAVDSNITTGQDWTYAAYADGTSNITLTGGTLHTSGERAYGLLAANNSDISSSATIITSGTKAHGVQAGANGSTGTGNDGSDITLVSGAKVTTSGSDAFGLHAIDGGTIDGTAVITTSGTNGFGAFAESASSINLTDGSIHTDGQYAHGLLANNDRNTTAGTITANNTNVTTTDDWAFAAYADKGATITLADGTLTTEGERAYGLHAANSSSISSSAEIITSGTKAHGVQAGANGSTGTGNDGSVITLESGAKVTTSGSDAFGLHVIDGGSIDGTATIITNGTNGFGAFAESASSINLSGGSIRTNGQYAHGLLANNDRNTTAGTITTDNTNVTTTDDWAFAAYADKGATITLTDGTFTTEGERAYGLHAANSSSISSSAEIITSGTKAHGVQAGANGSTGTGNDGSVITLVSGAKVTTSGSDAFGLHAIDGGSIDGTATIITNGTNGFGAFAESASSINLTGGSIRTNGQYAHGLLANNDRNTTAGTITTDNTDVTTTDDWAFAAYADKGSTITLAGGTLQTSGERAYGLLAGDNSTINSNATIITEGAKAHGAQTSTDGNSARTGGTINFTGGSVTTEGNAAYGLHAVGKGLIQGNVTVNTSGTASFGAFAESDSRITLQNSVIHTTGTNAVGLLANNDEGRVAGLITVSNTSVTTAGNNASGVFVSSGGTVSLTGGSVATTGTGAAALQVYGTGTINVLGTTLSSALAPTLQVNLVAATDVATISFGAGTTATTNNGVLANVNRSGDGKDATFNLTLKAGSVSSGDIIDTDTKDLGKMNVVIEKNASFTGKILGITDFTAGVGTHTNFAEGTAIAGNLTGTGSTFTFHSSGGAIQGHLQLTAGSVTSGGSISSPITLAGDAGIDATSILGGNWLITGNLNANGTIRPGNSIGIVTVGGNATYGSDFVYDVEVAGDGTSDQINVVGTATINGSKLIVTALDPQVSYKNIQTYTVMTAAGGIEGAFSEVTSGSIFLRTQIEHKANSVDLHVAVLQDTFEPVGQTSNQKSTARALDSLEQSGSSLELYNSIIFLTSEEEARSAFTQLSGSANASVKTALIETSSLTADAINNRLRTAFEGVASKDTPLLTASNAGNETGSAYDAAFWATGLGSWMSYDGNGNTGGLKTSTGGFLSGVDIGMASGWRLGVLGGYSKTDIHGKGVNSSANSDNWHLGIYGGNQWGALGLRAGLVNTWHSIDSARSVAYTDLSENLAANYDARSLHAFGEVGYRIDASPAAFEPFANLSHVSLHTKAFSENGGLAALSTDSDNTNTTFTTVGIRASTLVNLNAMDVNLKATLGWRHAYGDIIPTSTHAFGGSNAFTVEGVAIAKDAALIEAGLDMAISNTAKFGINYVGQFSNGATQNGFNAVLNVKF